jgi:hypothetical protein
MEILVQKYNQLHIEQKPNSIKDILALTSELLTCELIAITSKNGVNKLLYHAEMYTIST